MHNIPCTYLNTLRPRQNGHRFPDNIFKCIFLNENVWILIKISLKFVPKGPINDIPSLVQTMAWRRSGDRPLSEPMMVSLLRHICVALPQWIKDHMCVISDLLTLDTRYHRPNDSAPHGIAVFKITTICLARDLWKLSRSCKQLRLLCPLEPWNLPGTALPNRFQRSRGVLKSTELDNT